MKRKFKLMSSIASLSLAVMLLIGGVLAAANRDVNIAGTVTFTAENISATVVVRQGADVGSLGPIGETIVYAVGDTNAEQEVARPVELSAALTDSVLTYVYQIEITSTFAAGASNITVTLDDKFTDVDWITDAEVVVEGTAVTKSATGATLAPSETVIYTFSYTVKANEAPTSGNFPVGSDLVLVRTAV